MLKSHLRKLQMRSIYCSLILVSIFCVGVVAQESQRDKGILLFQEGKYSEAVEVLRTSTETEDQSSATWIYLVFSYLKLGDEPAANRGFESYKKVQFKPPFVQPKIYDTPVRLREKPKAKYTNEASRAGVGGEVLLWIEFQADGSVGAIYTKKPLPHGLTESAIKAARKIRFDPAVRNGKPVTVVLSFSYNFATD